MIYSGISLIYNYWRNKLKNEWSRDLKVIRFREKIYNFYTYCGLSDPLICLFDKYIDGAPTVWPTDKYQSRNTQFLLSECSQFFKKDRWNWANNAVLRPGKVHGDVGEEHRYLTRIGSSTCVWWWHLLLEKKRGKSCSLIKNGHVQRSRDYKKYIWFSELLESIII